MRRPIVEISVCTHCRDTPDLAIDRGGTQRHGTTASESAGPDIAHLGHRSQKRAGREHVVPPTVHREVTLGVATSAEREHQCHPAHLGGDAIGQFREGTG